MGSKQSTPRRISIPNEEDAGVIKVSDSVVSRLKGNNERTSDSTDKSIEAKPPQPQSSIKGEHVGLPPASPQEYYEPTITSLQILQDKERELRKNDQYWEQRLVKLQENQRHMNKVMEQEYEKAVKEVSMRFGDDPKKVSNNNPCQDKRSAVMQCYKEYPKNTLNCTSAVQAFADCVNCSRLKVLDNRS